MWVDKQRPVGEETILVSSQFLYLLLHTLSIISEIEREERTPIMNQALRKFVPLLMEHYNRWIFNVPGPFQVRGWGCRFNGKYVKSGMNHFEFLKMKLGKRLGDAESPAYCNAVQDLDMWIIAGVTNILAVCHRESLSISSEQYKKMLNYLKIGIKLLESRFTYTELKNFDGEPVIGAIFDRGAFDEQPSYAFAGYDGEEHPGIFSVPKSSQRGLGVGWDLSHARRFVHVFYTLFEFSDILGLDFPTRDTIVKMGNQLVYGTFNRDFKKPLFTNFMDGTNGWYRVGYSGKTEYGHGPWDLSIAVLTGGYGLWSLYNPDVKKTFIAVIDMLKSNDPEIRKHVVEYYEKNARDYLQYYWNQSVWRGYKRFDGIDFNDNCNLYTELVLIQFLPSICFIKEYTGRF